MKQLYSKKGQLLIYFLVIMSLAAMTIGAFYKVRMGQIKHQQRGAYINELYLECRSNMEIIKEAIYTEGLENLDTVEQHNRALLNFIKVKNREFTFSIAGMKPWIMFQATLSEAGMLADTAEPPWIKAGYLNDLIDTHRSMAIWLNNAKIHDNNFKF